MKKIYQFLCLGIFLFTSVSSAQIGIGNTNPKATLDVNKTTYSTGEQAGIAVTLLTASQIENMDTNGLKSGTLVYATTTSAIIKSIGFWYYDGVKWTKIGDNRLNVTNPSTNDYTVLETDDIIYRNLTGDGTLTFPNSLPAGKVYHIIATNNSGISSWFLDPLPENTTHVSISPGEGIIIVTLGDGKIAMSSGY